MIVSVVIRVCVYVWNSKRKKNFYFDSNSNSIQFLYSTCRLHLNRIARIFFFLKLNCKNFEFLKSRMSLFIEAFIFIVYYVKVVAEVWEFARIVKYSYILVRRLCLPDSGTPSLYSFFSIFVEFETDRTNSTVFSIIWIVWRIWGSFGESKVKWRLKGRRYG